MNVQPVYRDDHELMGFVKEDEDGNWIPTTIFGYEIDSPSEQNSAIATILEKGLSILTEKWEFFDDETKEWRTCLILEAHQNEVKIQEGFYPDSNSKILTLHKPTKEQLRLQ